MPRTRVLITVATYNELGNLPRLVESIFSETDRFSEELGLTCDLLVVDDDSPDGTGAWCDAQADRFPRLKCLHRAGKLGLGSAVTDACQYAIRERYDRLVNLDADFSHPPRFLEALLRESADVVIGSRYTPGGKIENWPLLRHFTSWGVNTFGRLRLGLRVRDISGSYRNYSVSALENVDFARMQSRGYSFFEEILWRMKRTGATMTEVPITFEERRAGVSKVGIRESFVAIWTLLTLRP